MGLFGIDGGLFRAPGYIDTSKPAGSTSYNATGYGSNWIKNYLTLNFYFNSPQFVWSLLSILVYVVFPYDIGAAKEWRMDWILYRAAVNAGVFLVYTGFWHVTLYWLGFANRKFSPGVVPKLAMVIHNIYYGVLGTLMQTAWECIFLRLWATGRLEYIPDNQIFASLGNIIHVLLGIFIVPASRDFHFYFAHRFIHLRSLYKYIHSLHHRNTSPEPFSGLCMHPIEHLYYVSCMALHLFFFKSPLHLMANGFHCTISPAAGHSGWEDNWQSDIFHYLHHAKFECNYGTPGIPFDRWFGTYQHILIPPEQLKEKEQQLKQHKQKSYIPTGGVTLEDALPSSIQSSVFWIYTALLFIFAAFCLRNDTTYFFANKFAAKIVAATVAASPVVVSMALWASSADKFHFLWPFHREQPPVLYGHVLMSFIMTTVPVYFVVLSALSPTTVPCTIWGQC